MANILLADDDADMREICQRLIPARGHSLTLATNAADAVKLAGESRPDLVFMDMRMPEREGGTVNDQAGIDAARRILASDGLAGTPIVALTGHTMRNFKESILEAGCCAILAKPVENLMDLLTLIERHARRKEG